jgi:insulysin
VPIKDEDELSLAWVLPYTGHDIDRRPLDYFSHLLGHEGQNSILSYLKAEGLAISLSAGGDNDLWAFSSMTVSVTLTKKGLE